jgi:rhamnogalacturonan endolyase
MASERFSVKTVVIIGGGFCGTLTAVNLARLSTDPLRIVLVNNQYPLGRGIAYGTLRPEHLLNVVACKVSCAVMLATLVIFNLTAHACFAQTAGEPKRRAMENLGRGLVALNQGNGKVFVSWRLLGTDPDGIAFNLYRATGDQSPVKLNPDPITRSTHFVDRAVDLSHDSQAYFVRQVLDGREGLPTARFVIAAHAPVQDYLAIPLKTLAGYTANDAAVGDLDGDGEYEIIIKQEMRGYDNSQRGVCPGTTKLEAYRLDGAFLWRIDLGKNIREGAHYTPFIVYDLDGDGRSEVAVRTAEGTVDGAGVAIGDTDGDGRTDYVGANGYILEGPEFLSIFDGRTGKEIARAPYLARGRVADWGDSYGNRVDRFLMGVGYFDGERPSVIMCRGYYTITHLQAWNWRDGKLTMMWNFDTRSRPEYRPYEGQGNHNLSIGDIDNDGRDEIVYGAMCLDDDGRPLYNTRLGHGDAIHLSDIDPDRPGLEVFDIHERARHAQGAEFRDARTGQLIWGKPSPDVGRGVALDIDPRHRGYEMWASGRGLTGLWNVKGETIADRKPRSCNFGVWWDGDLLRELLDRTTISKWNWQDQSERTLLAASGCAANNSTKATPCLCADILGDWREEVIWRTADSRELRIYTTTIPTEHRLYTLMHDPTYRISAALQNVGYNQPTQPGFYLGDGMKAPPRPAITTTVAEK